VIEVVITGISYVDDLPADKLSSEQLGEQLRPGSTVGLIVQLVNDPEKSALINLLVTADAQKTLIQKGRKIAIEQKSDYYVIPREWEEYGLAQGNGKFIGKDVMLKVEIKDITSLASFNRHAA
jgi:hypothetical protein